MFKRSDRFSFRNTSPRQKKFTPLFIVKFQKAETTPHYAVVSGKVVSKKAVLRNRAKRVFIATLKEIVSKEKNSFDLVFFLRKPFHEYQKSAIIGDLEQIVLEINKQNS